MILCVVSNSLVCYLTFVGKAGAIRLGISRALLSFSQSFYQPLEDGEYDFSSLWLNFGIVEIFAVFFLLCNYYKHEPIMF